MSEKTFRIDAPRTENQACSWKCHFTGVAREVIGYLERLADRREDRFVYASVADILKHCNEKYLERSKKPHKRTVEDVLRVLRELQILHGVIERNIGGGRGDRRGRVLNPHDSMTVRYPHVCRFIGPGQRAGVWSRNGMWQPDVIDQAFGLIIGDLPGDNCGGLPGGLPGRLPSATVVDAVKNCGGQRGDQCGSDSLELLESTPDKQIGDDAAAIAVFAKNNSYPGESVYPGEPGEPVDPKPAIETGSDVATTEGKSEEGKGVVSSFSESLTHKPNRTVGQHFEGKSLEELIYTVTDGVVTPPVICNSNAELKLRQAYETLKFGVSQAVGLYKNVPLTDRRALAKIMNAAISNDKAPKAFFKTMKEFQEKGGEIVLKPPPPEPPKSKFDVENFGSFRTAWEALAADPDVPRSLLEEYYERDVLPDKPPAPWRTDGN